MKLKTKKLPVWVFVTAERGIPVEAEAYTSRQRAEQRKAAWRKTMNDEYDAAAIFPVSVK
jgi:hypothetical protein